MIPSLLASAVASAQNLSIFDPASPSAESIRKLSVLVLAITGFIFVVVEGILFYSIFSFRVGARSGDRAPTFAGLETCHTVGIILAPGKALRATDATYRGEGGEP